MLRSLVDVAGRAARHIPSRYASELVRASWRFAPRPEGPLVVDCDGLQIEVDPAIRRSVDTAVYYHHTYEAGLLDVISQHVGPDDLYVDVGAYTGFIALTVARHAKEVHAFEPHPGTADVLERNIDRNQVANVAVHRTALGSASGTAEIFDHPDNAGGNTLHAVSSSGIPVTVETLDSYGLDPAFVKIDVEGWELEVLRGSVETLERSRPVLSVEVSTVAAGEDAAAPVRFLTELGYEAFRLARGKEVPSRLIPVGSDLPRHDNVFFMFR